MGFFRDEKIRDLEDVIRQQEAVIESREKSIEALECRLADTHRRIEIKTKVDGIMAVSELMRERKKLDARIEDLEHELRLARQHRDRCPTAQAVEDHDRDKARSNQ